MKRLFLLIFVFTSFFASGQLLEEDKQAHIIAGTAAGIPTYFFNKSVLKVENTYWNYALTAGEGLLIGWAFEHYQKSTGRGVYDNMDILATATGFLSGALLGRVLEHDPDRFHKRTLRRERKVQRQLKRIEKRKKYYESINR